MLTRRKFLTTCGVVLGSSVVSPTGQAFREDDLSNDQSVDDLLDRSIPNHNDAIDWVLADLANQPESIRQYQRYIWIPQHLPKGWESVVAFVINSISRSPTIVTPHLAAEGQLVRFDMRIFAPNPKDYDEIFELYEKLAEDEPYFHVTNEVAKVVKKKKSNGKKSSVEEVKIVAKQPIYGGHLELDKVALLVGSTKSNAALLRAEYFVHRVLTQVDGGLYYKFLKIPKSKDKNKTDLTLLFESLGIDPKIVGKKNAAQRAAMFKSGITGKPRLMESLPTLSSRDGTGRLMITSDIKNKNFQPERHAIYNLAKFEPDAHEVLYLKENGLMVGIIYDGDGKLVDEVPPDIISDHTIPGLNTTKQLQPGISCITCHGPSDGWKPVANDVLDLTNGLDENNVIGDLLGIDKELPDLLSSLASQYRANLDKQLERLRADYSEAVFSIGFFEINKLTEALSKGYYSWRDGDITPEIALAELGFKIVKGDAGSVFRGVVGKLPALKKSGIIREDPAVLQLKLGKSIPRVDWNRIFPDVALRTKLNVKALSQKVDPVAREKPNADPKK